MSVLLKKTAAAVLAPSGVLRLGGAAKALGRGQLLLLGYHRVMPLDEMHSGDVELVSCTPDAFAWQMDYLARRFEPVTFERIADALDGKALLPKRAVAVTFDDGFSDLYEHAFPILRRYRMPATVFVSTGYVDRPEPFWFDLVAWLLMKAPRDFVPLEGTLDSTPLGADPAVRRARTVAVLKWLKSCSEEERIKAVAELCSRFPAEVAEGRAKLGRALTWNEMREMAAGGIEFGSHTVTHCCLSKVQPAQLDLELRESKARLESQLGSSVCALAYPFGGRGAFNGEVVATAKRLGYRVATSYIPGVNHLERADRFALLRQHVERGTSRAYFEALVNAPEWFD